MLAVTGLEGSSSVQVYFNQNIMAPNQTDITALTSKSKSESGHFPRVRCKPVQLSITRHISGEFYRSTVIRSAVEGPI